jgi:hypothetical protein
MSGGSVVGNGMFGIAEMFGTIGALRDDVCTYWFTSFCRFLTKLL